MSPVPSNRAIAPLGVLLGGTGLARLPARRSAVLPALLRPRPRTPDTQVCEAPARSYCAAEC